MYAATLCCTLVLLTAFSVGLGHEKLARQRTENVSNQTVSEDSEKTSPPGVHDDEITSSTTEGDPGEELKELESSTASNLEPRTAGEKDPTVATPQEKNENGTEVIATTDKRKKKKYFDPFSTKIFLGEINGIRVKDSALPNVSTFLNYTGLNVFSIDYHYRNKTVFYTCLNRIFKDNVVGRLTRVGAPSMLTDVGVEGNVRLAVDWVHDRIYWMALKYQTVESSNIDGSNRTLLFDSLNNTLFPNNIAVDPYKGYVFLVSNPRIYRFSLDGSNLTQLELPQSSSRSVRCLTLDIYNQRIIYFGKIGDYNSGKPFLASCGYEGDHQKDFTFAEKWNDIYSMDVFRDTLYFAHYKQGSLDTLWNADLTKDPLEPVRRSSSQGLWSVKVYHPEAQAEPKSLQKDINNH